MQYITDYIDKAEYSIASYQDIKIKDNIISLLIVGINGLYVFLDDLDEKINRTIIDNIITLLHLDKSELFYFIISDTEEDGFFYDYKQDKFIKYDDIYNAYSNCYDNHLIYEADLNSINFETNLSYLEDIDYKTSLTEDEEADAYIEPVLGAQQCNNIISILDKEKEKPEIKGKYLYYPDGTVKTKRVTTKDISLKGFVTIPTYIEDGEKIYKCMDIDPDKYFYYTLFGGWFGLHKFMSKNILSGILYLLSFGCCGIFWIYDLLSIIMGNYYSTSVEETDEKDLVNQRYYLKPVQNKLKYIIFTVIAGLITFIFVKYFYPKILMDIVNTIITPLSQNQSIQNGVNNLIG